MSIPIPTANTVNDCEHVFMVVPPSTVGIPKARLEALEAYERYGAGEEYRSDYRTAAELRAAHEALWVENKGLRTRLEALERLEQLHRVWKEAIAARMAAKAEWDKQAVPNPLEIARVVSELITAKEALEAWTP